MPANIAVRAIGDAEIAAFVAMFEVAWSVESSDEERARIALDLAGESMLGGYAGAELAGTAMAFSLELTVPGEVSLPMAGVSYVAVHPLRRRRGVMRALMRRQLDDLHARGIPVAGLGASEAGIYGRFGYGPATWDSSWRLARRAVRHLADIDADMDADMDKACSLNLVDTATARDIFPGIHEAARQTQVGDVRTYPGRWRDLIGDVQRQHGRQFVLCRDKTGQACGYASYRVERAARYSEHGTVIVDHLIASTDVAYRTLWAHLGDVDLTDWVVASGRPEQEPLRWALADSRQLVVTGVRDHLWIRLVDLPTALKSRRYAADGSVILEVTDPFCPWNEGRWLLTGGPDGAECRPAAGAAGAAGAGEPMLRLDIAALGSLFLGGVSVAHLALAGRIQGDSASLRRAHQMFRSDPAPWCSTEF